MFQIFPVPFFFQVLFRDKTECSGVDAVAEPSRHWSVRKNMAKVGVTMFTSYLYPINEKVLVLFFNNIIRLKQLGKTRPTRTGFELVG